MEKHLEEFLAYNGGAMEICEVTVHEVAPSQCLINKEKQIGLPVIPHEMVYNAAILKFSALCESNGPIDSKHKDFRNSQCFQVAIHHSVNKIPLYFLIRHGKVIDPDVTRKTTEKPTST
ncbi:hypothetical protein STEG23_022183 [Scotinomys teguina]